MIFPTTEPDRRSCDLTSGRLRAREHSLESWPVASAAVGIVAVQPERIVYREKDPEHSHDRNDDCCIGVDGTSQLFDWPSIFCYPPVVFCFVWSADLLLVRLAGSFFFPIADDTLVVFCLGALAISVGSAIGLLIPQQTARQCGPASTKAIDVILNCLFL